MSNRRRWSRRKPRATVQGSPVALPGYVNADNFREYVADHAGEWLLGGDSRQGCTSPLCEHQYVPDPEIPERVHLLFRHYPDCALHPGDGSE